jgi:hypothetical protein
MHLNTDMFKEKFGYNSTGLIKMVNSNGEAFSGMTPKTKTTDCLISNHSYTKTVQLTWLQRIKAMFTGKFKVILNGSNCATERKRKN